MAVDMTQVDFWGVSYDLNVLKMWLLVYDDRCIDNAVINFCHNHPPPAHPRGFAPKRACEVNFCRTFTSSISLFLELAGSILAQTLLNPSKVVWHWL